MIEPITTHRWSTDGYPFAVLGVRVDELARRLGVSLQEWNVDGIGPARGFGFRVPSGRVYLLEEVADSVRFYGARGPTVYVDAADLAGIGAERLVAEFVTELGLSRSEVTDIAGPAGEQRAAEIVAEAAAAGAKNCL